MKKRSGVLLGLVLLMVLALGVGSALAAMAAPYSSWCTADTNVSSDSGDGYAYAFDNNSSYYAAAESIAMGWGLGAQAEVSVEDSFQGDAYAHAEFDQQFVVTASGPASINFSYDGWLSAANLGDGTVDGSYDVWFGVDAYDDLGNYGGDSYSINDLGDDLPSDTFSFTYNFDQEAVGSTFWVTLVLDAGVSAEYISYVVEEGQSGSAEFQSDFYNTAEITGYDGGIAPVGGPPVPIPGALWLLGSGLFGLVAVRRRKDKA